MILVTGGNGFIGRYVCATLAAHGKRVIALDKNSPNAFPNETSYLTITGDITQQEQIEQIFRQYHVTTLIHLASLLNTASQAHPSTATQVNILGSLNLFEIVRKFQVARVIYGSSISVYGSVVTHDADDKRLISSPPAPENLYGAAKRYIEILGERYQKQFGMPFVALRIATVIGRGVKNSGSPWRSKIFETLGLPREVQISIPYKAEEQLPLVYVEDVAEMMTCLVEARHLALTIYNTPAETWTMQALAAYIESLAPHIRFAFGQSRSGTPPVVSGKEFITEFGYNPALSIRERLRLASLNKTTLHDQ
jgi:UDP-glucose 4-epimerase